MHAAKNGDVALFDNRDHPMHGFAMKDVKKSRWGTEEALLASCRPGG